MLIAVFDFSGHLFAQNIVAQFNSGIQQGCAPLAVQFNNMSTGAISWHWDFGDGNTSQLQNPVHVYNQQGNYDVQLIAFNASGTDTLLIPAYINVIPHPVAAFQLSDTTSCINGSPITFYDQSTGAVQWFWDFGDGNTSTLQNPQHTYSTSGYYTVSLIVHNADSCVDFISAQNNIHIYPLPVVALSVDTIHSCQFDSYPYQFSDITTGSQSRQWTFPDGFTSTNANLVHVFPDSLTGYLPVQLSVNDNHGCSNTNIFYHAVRIWPAIMPQIVLSDTDGCAPLTIFATDNNAPPIITNFNWDMGDGNLLSGNPVQHVYQDTGQFTVTIAVEDQRGCVYHDTTGPLEITPYPQAMFVRTQSAQCGPVTVTFTNLSINAQSFYWEFGDGNTSTAPNPVHQYNIPGNYFVRLTASNAIGCEDAFIDSIPVVVSNPVAGFASTLHIGCPPLEVHFFDTSLYHQNRLWDFGDGNQSSAANPVHVYSTAGQYDLRLIAFGNNGCSDTVFMPAYVQAGPDTVFVNTPVSVDVCAPYTVQFEDLDPGNTQWLWLFGDGDSATAQQVSHTYLQSGSYTVSLLAGNTNGCGTYIGQYAIYNVHELTPQINVDWSISCPDFKAGFSDTTAGVNQWQWVFSDGTTDTAQYPLHVFGSPGIYNVGLTVSDTFGCSASITANNIIGYAPCTINPGGGGPAGSGGGGAPAPDTITSAGCAPMTVQFYNPMDSTLVIDWDFGDGIHSNAQQPFHIYNTADTFDVSLVYLDTNSGATDTLYFPSNIITTKPIAQYSASTLPGCDSTDVFYINQSVDATDFLWNLGDGTQTTVSSPAHRYNNNAGVYPVSLKVTDDHQCQSTAASTLYFGNTQPSFNYQSYACGGDSIAFSTTLMAATYLWDFGDGNTSTDSSPIHVYPSSGNYTVTLQVTTPNGCMETYALPVPVVISQPVADFSVQGLLHGCDSLTVQLNNQSTGSQMFEWTLNGITFSNLENPLLTIDSSGVFDLGLIVTGGGCVAQKVDSGLLSVSQVDAAFTMQQSSMCMPVTINFQNQSSGAQLWNWSLGDGTTSSVENPTHVYDSLVDDFIVLTALDTFGCSAMDSLPVFTYLQASFWYNVSDFCMPYTVNFFDNSQNAVSWNWQFGDGGTDSIWNPSSMYGDTGTYTVTLVVTAADGCTDTIYKPNLVHVVRPEAAFSSDAHPDCAPLVVQFTDSSSNNVTGYFWDFGDGATSNLKDPQHVYTVPGTYDLLFVVTDVHGCSDSIFMPGYIQVQGPISSFQLSTTDICAGQDISFINTSQDALDYLWDFGDGDSTQTLDPDHQYDLAGSFNVTLITTDTNGCQDAYTMPGSINVHPYPDAQIAVMDTSVCLGDTVSFSAVPALGMNYFWQLGNTASGSQTQSFAVSNNPGSTNLQLIVTSQYGCSDTDIAVITTYMPPVPSFLATQFCTGGPSVFTNQSTVQDSSIISSWAWDFGDSSGSMQMAPQHTFPGAGSYQVVLTAITDHGCMAQTTQQIQISSNQGVSFTAAAVCEGDSMSFTDNTAGAVSWLWDFGDGSPVDTSHAPKHLFGLDGTYMVHLSTELANGCTGDTSIPVVVHPLPVADFGFVSACSGLPVQFSDSSSISSGSIVSWQWDYGDSTGASGAVQQHVYNMGQDYQVVLAVLSDHSCSSQMMHIIDVPQTPQAAFVTDIQSGCAPLEVSYTNLSSGLNDPQWFWQLGTNVTSNDSNPSAVYTLPGYYTTTLIVTNAGGCADTAIVANAVFVPDTTAPERPSVLTATVTGNTENYIVWQPGPDPDAQYVLYRQNAAGLYVPIDTAIGNQNITFTRNDVDALHYAYRYKIAPANRCGYGWPLDSLTAYRTIELSAHPLGDVIELNWNAYEGCSVGAYEVYRQKKGTQAIEKIASIPSGLTHYIDSSAWCPEEYSYRIKAIKLCGSLVSAQSDTAIAKSTGNLIRNFSVDIQRSTVFENMFVMSEWHIPDSLKELINGFDIYRSENGNEYEWIRREPADASSFLDTDVQVDSAYYLYRITPVNICDLELEPGRPGSSILLSVKGNDYARTLSWTPYADWDTGVDHYIIERMNEQGEWEVISVVDGKITEYNDK